jgi:outer membrane protein
MTHSPEMLMAETQAKRAKEAVRESRSLNRLQVVAGTGLAYNNGFPLSIEGAAPSIFQVGANQPFLSKKNKNLIREAEQSEMASRLSGDSTGNDLASKTVLAYSRLYQARRRSDLAAESLTSAEAYLKTIQSMAEAGKIRSIDISTAKISVSSARQQLLIAREQAGIAEAELQAYTGIAADVSIRPVEPVLVSPSLDADAETLYGQILTNSPEIQQAEADIRSKEFHLEATKGERLPQMSLVGEYAVLSKANNYEDYFNQFSRNNYLLGLSLQVPIFDGRRASARIAQSHQEVSEARYRLQQIKSDLKLATLRGLSALRIAEGAEEYARDATAAAREKMRIDELLLQSGKISQMEFEESRSGLFQKEFAQIEAEQALFERKLDVLRITGGVASALQ